MNIQRLFSGLALLVIMLTACLRPQVVQVPVTVMVTPRLGDYKVTAIPTPARPTPLLSDDDVLSTSATVFWAGPGPWVDFRVQLTQPPFDMATHHFAWCLDIDQDATTGDPCGTNTSLGTDWGFTLRIGPDALLANNYLLGGDRTGYNTCDFGAFDWTTNTLRMVFPLPVIADDDQFNYDVALSSSPGNSSAYFFNFGSPGSFSTSQIVENPLPFNSVPLCALRF
jgi:hypothetical protein